MGHPVSSYLAMKEQHAACNFMVVPFDACLFALMQIASDAFFMARDGYPSLGFHIWAT